MSRSSETQQENTGEVGPITFTDDSFRCETAPNSKFTNLQCRPKLKARIRPKSAVTQLCLFNKSTADRKAPAVRNAKMKRRKGTANVNVFHQRSSAVHDPAQMTRTVCRRIVVSTPFQRIPPVPGLRIVRKIFVLLRIYLLIPLALIVYCTIE